MIFALLVLILGVALGIFTVGMAAYVAGAVLGIIIYLIARHKQKKNAYKSQPVLYVGNYSTRKYHRPDCSTLQYDNQSHLVNFRAESEPAAYGFTPCELCIKKQEET